MSPQLEAAEGKSQRFYRLYFDKQLGSAETVILNCGQLDKPI